LVPDRRRYACKRPEWKPEKEEALTWVVFFFLFLQLSFPEWLG
jgi:hypothetical protein